MRVNSKQGDRDGESFQRAIIVLASFAGRVHCSLCKKETNVFER